MSIYNNFFFLKDRPGQRAIGEMQVVQEFLVCKDCPDSQDLGVQKESPERRDRRVQMDCKEHQDPTAPLVVRDRKDYQEKSSILLCRLLKGVTREILDFLD